MGVGIHDYPNLTDEIDFCPILFRHRMYSTRWVILCQMWYFNFTGNALDVIIVGKVPVALDVFSYQTIVAFTC